MSRFLTIRQTAKSGVLSEYRLRLMVAQGTCPGIHTGNKFLINVDALVEQLERQSRSMGKGNGELEYA